MDGAEVVSEQAVGPEPADLAGALRRAGLAEVSTAAVDRAAHSTDASLYRVVPQVVVHPRHPDDLDAVLAVARAHGTSVTMRGSGTSIAGNAVGPGIVVDTRRHLHRILALDPDSGLATLQPGVVHADLQRLALAAGWRYGPDPSTHSRCTVGGMVGNNACGSRALGYGRTADTVEALAVTWGNGERQHLAAGVRDGVAGALADLVSGDLAHVRTTFGRFSRQVSGYSLEHLLPERLRPERLVVGSEGTLALVREVTVQLVREPEHRTLLVAGFPSIAEAADLVPDLLPVPGLVACEGLDERIVRLVPNAPPLPPGRAWLLLELTAPDAEQLDGRVQDLLRRLAGVPSTRVNEPAQAAALWRIREDGAGLAARSLGRPAHAGWEDAAVPPEHLGAWLREFEHLLAEHDLDAVPYGHFGDGCVHARIDFTFDDGGARFESFLRECATALAAHGGSLSGEHGDGRARSALLPLMYDADSLDLFAEVKRIADPDRLLNPGVLVDPAPLTRDLRPARPVLPLAPGRLVADLAEAAHRCTGVGRCVAAGTPTSVMCPSWQATSAEKDSTRGRARVLAEALDAGPDTVARGLGDPALAEALDLCLACKGCARDCPTGVDMAAVKAEVLAATHAGWRGWWRRPRWHHSLGRLPVLLNSPLRGAVRWAAGHPRIGRLAARVGGLDPERRLPTPDRAPVRRHLVERSGTAGAPDVWIWADSFTDHFGVEVVEATLEVLAQAGVRARVLEAGGCCGLTLVSTGQVGAAARSAGHLLETLAPFADRPILVLEPSCLATLRSDVPTLAGPEHARAAEAVLAAATSLAEVLDEARRAGRWSPPDLSGTTVVAQPHCHQHAVGGWEVDEQVLRATGADVVRVGGCCGLAGTFGMVPEHRDVSAAVADLQLLPALRAHPDAVVLADGLSCRTQIEHLGPPGHSPPQHLATLLRSP